MDHDSLYWLTHDDQLFAGLLSDMYGMVRNYEDAGWLRDATRITSVIQDNTTRLADMQVSENSRSSGSPGADSTQARKRKTPDEDDETVPRRLVHPERGATHQYCSSAPDQPDLKSPAITEFAVGWICALPLEGSAAIAMLDDEFPALPRDPRFSTIFRLGRVGPHKVVIACLPAGQVGKLNASSVAKEMCMKFCNIRLGFMVGIGGGVPTSKDDIRLGDVVVSRPTTTHGGVVQYDIGKAEKDGRFRRTGHLNNPPTFLLSVLSRVQINHERGRRTYPDHMARYTEANMEDYTYPRNERDILFRSSYPHPTGTFDCTTCNPKQVIKRPDRNTRTTTVKVHYGTIASGNQVIKDAQRIDKIVKDLGGQVLCFEMEAAGLMNDFPCLVVRGISDYCDSHKNDGWQRYAAANAAAYTKELLLQIPPEDVVK